MGVACVCRVFIVAGLALSCSSSSGSNTGGVASDVDKACDTIVNKCGAGANGFTLDECVQKMNENSVACTKCVVGLSQPCAMNGSEPNYISLCQDPANNCDLK